MKQLKILSVSLMVSVFVFFGLSRNVDASNNPWTAVWTAIRDLSAQIAAIPAGPQGPAGVNGTNGTNGVDGVDGGQGPQGIQGPTGLQGIPGPAGAGLDKTRMYRSLSAFIPVPFGPVTTAEATCNDNNDILISGGFWGSHGGIITTASFPNPSFALPTWTVGATTVGADGLMQAIAYCYRVD